MARPKDADSKTPRRNAGVFLFGAAESQVALISSPSNIASRYLHRAPAPQHQTGNNYERLDSRSQRATISHA